MLQVEGHEYIPGSQQNEQPTLKNNFKKSKSSDAGEQIKVKENQNITEQSKHKILLSKVGMFSTSYFGYLNNLKMQNKRETSSQYS
jgi:hypothetical protein